MAVVGQELLELVGFLEGEEEVVVLVGLGHEGFVLLIEGGVAVQVYLRDVAID